MTRLVFLQLLIFILLFPQNLRADDAAKTPKVIGDIWPRDPRVKGDIWQYDSWYEFPVRMLSFEELKALNSEEFIEKMKQTSLLYVVEDVKDWGSTSQERVVKNWPKEEDIPYLLSIVGSKEECGRIYHTILSVKPEPGEEKTTVGKAALWLLSDIKKGEFNTLLAWGDGELPSEEVLVWAREKVKEKAGG